MIIVTGATGQLGRAIIEQLSALVPPETIGASVRDEAKAEGLAHRGVRVRRGDFADPDSLNAAFEGATQVLIVSSNARATGGDTLAQHRNAIEAAKAAGARRIVYTSHMAANANSQFPPMWDHAATEAMLADSGVAWTSLRNGFYASTVPMLIRDAAQSGVIAAPADGKVSWTAHADLAAAAARILAEEGRFDGPTPPLTASEALDLRDVAGLLSGVSGRPVRREVVPDAEQEARMAAQGLPKAVIDISLGMYRASRAGEFSTVDPTLQQLLGRAPVPLRDVLAGNSAG